MSDNGGKTFATPGSGPAATGHPAPVVPDQQTTTGDSTGIRTQETILLVENVPEFRELLTAVLTSHDYAVIAAADGPSGLRALHEHDPDLVILDHGMPEMAGMEVLATLRGEGMTVPVILLTAHRNDDALAWAYWKAGVSLFMEKPFEMRTLLRWVGDFLGDANGPSEQPVSARIHRSPA